MPLLSTSAHLPKDAEALHSPSPCLVTGWGVRRRHCGGSGGSRAMNASVTQAAAAPNCDAILKILRERLHKCRHSGDTDGRLLEHGGLFSMNKFICTPAAAAAVATRSSAMQLVVLQVPGEGR